MLPILARWVVEQQRLHSLQQPQHQQQQDRHHLQDHRQHPREEYHRQEQWWQEQEEDAKLENLFSGLGIHREQDAWLPNNSSWWRCVKISVLFNAHSTNSGNSLLNFDF